MLHTVGHAATNPQSAGEDDLLLDSRERFARVLITYYWAHPPVVLLIALVSGLAPGFTVILTALALVTVLAAQVARWKWGVAPAARHVISACGIALTGCLIAAATGTAYQIDMHMYVFVMVGVMIAWCDWRVFVTTTAAAAVHHLAVNIVAPHCIFPDGTDYLRVALHAAIVIIQAAFLVPASSRLAKALQSAERSEKDANRRAEDATGDLVASLDTEKRRQAAIGGLILEFRNEADSSAQAVVRETASMDTVARMLTEITEDGQAKLVDVRDAAVAVSDEVGTARVASNTMTVATRNIRENIDGAVRHVSNVMRETEESAVAVRGLAEASKEMNGILDVIRSVADQTSLLALNATIEAARAGEAGKSFAVVAAEVKGLAEQSGQATETISARIDSLGVYTQEVVEKIQRIGQSAVAVNDSTDAVTAAIDEQTSANDAMERSLSAVAASAERSTRAVEVLSDVMASGANAAGRVDEVARSVSTLSHAMHQAIAMLLANVEKEEALAHNSKSAGYLDPDAPAQVHFPSHGRPKAIRAPQAA